MLILLASCRKLVEDEFDGFDKIITVNSLLSEGEPLNIYISQTAGLSEPEIPLVSVDDIKLYRNDTLINLQYTENKAYSGDLVIAENDDYFLQVVHNGKVVETSCRVPAKPQILHSSIQEYGWLDEDGVAQPQVEIAIKNSKTPTYYEAIIVIYKVKDEEPLEVYPFALFDNLNVNADTITQYAKIHHYNSSYPPEKFKYQLIVRAVDYNYYRYNVSLNEYELTRFPDFSSSNVVPQNLYSNVKNGYGVFCACTQVMTDTIYPIR